MLPPTLVLVLACALLLFAALKTLRTALKTYRREKAETAAAEELAAPGTTPLVIHSESLPAASAPPAPTPHAVAGAPPLSRRDEPLLGASGPKAVDDAPPPSAKRSERLLLKVGSLVGFWLLFVADDFAVKQWGGKFCSGPHWGLLGALYVAVAVALVAGGVLARRTQLQRDASGAPVLRGDLCESPARAPRGGGGGAGRGGAGRGACV